MEFLEEKHEREKENLKKEIVALMKSVKKSNKAQMEAKVGAGIIPFKISLFSSVSRLYKWSMI